MWGDSSSHDAPCLKIQGASRRRQPYAVAARQLAARVAEECAEELGEGERVAYLGPGEEEAAVLGPCRPLYTRDF